MKEREHKPEPGRSPVSRRNFFNSVAAGVTGAAIAGSGTPAEAAPRTTEEPEGAELVRITLQVNGRKHSLLVEPRWNLLHVLREQLGMAATKPGCERGECGACTVLIDGLARYACMTLAVEAEGVQITTLEGLMQGEELGTVQKAFVEEDAFQCGYCTPGQVMSAEAMLRKNPHPSAAEIRDGMSGNLCRCGAYLHIFKAVDRAAQGGKA